MSEPKKVTFSGFSVTEKEKQDFCWALEDFTISYTFDHFLDELEQKEEEYEENHATMGVGASGMFSSYLPAAEYGDGNDVPPSVTYSLWDDQEAPTHYVTAKSGNNLDEVEFVITNRKGEGLLCFTALRNSELTAVTVETSDTKALRDFFSRLKRQFP